MFFFLNVWQNLGNILKNLKNHLYWKIITFYGETLDEQFCINIFRKNTSTKNNSNRNTIKHTLSNFIHGSQGKAYLVSNQNLW